MHEVVDIAHWKRLFPLAALRAEGETEMKAVMKHSPEFFHTKRAIEKKKAFYAPWAEAITSPYHLAVIEQYRDERAGDLKGLERVETDIFVCGKGEPKSRAVTKVGGLPYWPKNRDWPCGKDGSPLTFLAQVCFADSPGLAGELPGQVLAVFGDEFALDDLDADVLRFEWIELGDEKLIQRDSLPKTQLEVTPCYGAIYRTSDCPNAVRRFRGIDGAKNTAVLQGTKIGGVPNWIQRPARLAGRFLCSIGSVHPALDQPYPYLNNPRPLKDEEPWLLQWGDVGCLYVFIDKQGRLHATVQCY